MPSANRMLGRARDPRDGDAGPERVRPRLSRAPGHLAHRRRRRRAVRSPGPGAGDHAVGADRPGRRSRSKVVYRGHPQEVTDPDGSPDGWVRTDDGAFVAAEPQGAPTWFPCNDYPTDKARYEIRITVPKGTAAISNGALRERSVRRRWATWDWVERQPMATYLATPPNSGLRRRPSRVHYSLQMNSRSGIAR